MSNFKTEAVAGIYSRCSTSIPEKYDDYLVKTKGGTYEKAHFNQNGWTILGDNKGDIPIAWTPIPTTSVLE